VVLEPSKGNLGKGEAVFNLPTIYSQQELLMRGFWQTYDPIAKLLGGGNQGGVLTKEILPHGVAHCFSIESRPILLGYPEILSGQDTPSERRVTVEANTELLQEGEKSSNAMRTQHKNRNETHSVSA
jgi:hypothetical protein